MFSTLAHDYLDCEDGQSSQNEYKLTFPLNGTWDVVFGGFPFGIKIKPNGVTLLSTTSQKPWEQFQKKLFNIVDILFALPYRIANRKPIPSDDLYCGKWSCAKFPWPVWACCDFSPAPWKCISRKIPGLRATNNWIISLDGRTAHPPTIRQLNSLNIVDRPMDNRHPDWCSGRFYTTGCQTETVARSKGGLPK